VILWIDAQLSPALARWINDIFGIEVYAVRDIGLREANLLLERGEPLVEISDAR
jgi:predicted nuclease of predicted toxin-antitoxin system